MQDFLAQAAPPLANLNQLSGFLIRHYDTFPDVMIFTTTRPPGFQRAAIARRRRPVDLRSRRLPVPGKSLHELEPMAARDRKRQAASQGVSLPRRALVIQAAEAGRFGIYVHQFLSTAFGIVHMLLASSLLAAPFFLGRFSKASTLTQYDDRNSRRRTLQSKNNSPEVWRRLMQNKSSLSCF